MKLYVARDNAGALYLYRAKPVKEAVFWDSSCDSMELDRDLFPEVKFSDDEPKVITIEETPWIKVENRLPPIDDIVLCICKYRTDSNSYFHLINSIDKNNNWTMKCLASYDIIAWMPIPSFDEILESNKDVLKRLKEK